MIYSHPPNISHPRNGPNYVRIPYIVSFGGVCCVNFWGFRSISKKEIWWFDIYHHIEWYQIFMNIHKHIYIYIYITIKTHICIIIYISVYYPLKKYISIDIFFINHTIFRWVDGGVFHTGSKKDDPSHPSRRSSPSRRAWAMMSRWLGSGLVKMVV